MRVGVGVGDGVDVGGGAGQVLMLWSKIGQKLCDLR
jgi:hypothetical protein